MLWTLQSYIFREMGKTFLLTAVGLVAVLGLGGGIMNMIGLEQVTAWQLVKLMGIVLPIALALTLPIAALFSAASTYGRLSADNEFVACRGGGINILRLFLPALVISLVSAAVTFAFINYTIPGLIRNLNDIVRTDLEQIVVQGLKRPGGFALNQDRYRIFADHTAVRPDPDDPTHKRLLLDGVAFVEAADEDWVRFGSARTVAISFDTEGDVPKVRADLYGLSLFPRGDKAMSANLPENQTIGPTELPRRFPVKIKWLDLGELAYYRKHPDELNQVRESVQKARVLACAVRFYNRLVADFQAYSGRIELGGERRWLHIQAGAIQADPADGRIQLTGGVQIEEVAGGRRRSIAADRAMILAEPARELADVRAGIEVFDNVVLSDPADPTRTVTKSRTKLDSFAIDPKIMADIGALSETELLSELELALAGTAASKKRRDALESRGKALREIAGVLHSRLAFSVSVFVLVLLAAALGIIFRGAHVLTAFGVAFVPTVVVIVTIVAGRQLAENPHIPLVGLALLWSGIVVVAGLDGWILLRVLRR